MTGKTEIITFDGRRIEARHGESLAAALTAAGIRQFRTTAHEAPRGMFCGMGVCQDCLVEVDGRANERACMVKVTGPLVARSEAHARPLDVTQSAGAPKTIDDVRLMQPEVLVIGAGPGGLSAAIAARSAGAEVLMIDERSKPGGQYFKQPDVDGEGVMPPDAQHREGAALVERARTIGVKILNDVTVWGAFAPLEFAATHNGAALRIRPKRAIIATGAYERGWPVPGWTLPGVMTTGAAQTLWRTARRVPGKRVLIAGNGPLNLQLAAELADGGAEIVAVVEAAAAPGAGAIGELATMALASPKLVLDGIRYHRKRRKAGAPMIHSAVVRGIERDGGALTVSIGAADGGEPSGRYTVDAVCLGYGFEPANELLRGLGCGHDFDPQRRQLVTRRDDRGQTTVSDVYALGDCTGLGGARAALAEGTVIGSNVAASLGHAASGEADATAALARHRRFQSALWRLYAFDGYHPSLANRETLVCRCEEVSFGEIEDALAEDLSMIGAVKRHTRVGMGRCQGRYCAPVLDTLMAARAGRERDEFSGFAPRVPVRPVRIADIAGETVE
ncbi:FAD-dependent oxidoreductase [Martelella limonii]|uniref:FAD-dependent oxidoreductase n=1 Tax=Martelella limonii TaxID=1647649 RepID=UPI00157FCEA1|nr:FAD-dependent oxidoreductase [Martelella limonii]